MVALVFKVVVTNLNSFLEFNKCLGKTSSKKVTASPGLFFQNWIIEITANTILIYRQWKQGKVSSPGTSLTLSKSVTLPVFGTELW